MTNDNNLSLRQISAILLTKHNCKCSKTTIHEYLIKKDYINKNPITKPLLTDNNLNDRENWAIYYQNYDWSTVIWSDEAAISIQPKKFSKVWIHKDDKNIKRVKKYPLKVHVWGCIIKDYNLIVHIYDKTMNSDKYIMILKLKLLNRCV